MRGTLLVLVLWLPMSGCGEDVTSEIAGTYVLGRPHVAQFKADYFQARARGSRYVHGQLIRSDLIDPLLAQTDAALHLWRNGNFVYAGPPRQGEPELQLGGTWSFEDDAVQLRVTAAYPPHALLDTTITCPYRPGIVSYPAAPDAERPVYFDMATDKTLEKVPTGTARIRTEAPQ